MREELVREMKYFVYVCSTKGFVGLKISTLITQQTRVKVEWNSATPDTEQSVHISEMSLFQGLNYMQVTALGERKGVLIREVSSFQVSLERGSPGDITFFSLLYSVCM